MFKFELTINPNRKKILYIIHFIFKTGASVVVCKMTSSLSGIGVEHYYNNRGPKVTYLDTNNPTLGISGSSIAIDESNNMVCSYTRANSDSNTNYFNVNKDLPYILAAYGNISNGSMPKKIVR